MSLGAFPRPRDARAVIPWRKVFANEVVVDVERRSEESTAGVDPSGPSPEGQGGRHGERWGRPDEPFRGAGSLVY